MPNTGLTDGVTVLNSSLWDTMVREQVTVTCTSGTRPTNVEGRLIYETDTNTILLGTGSGTNWIVMDEDPQSFTPAWGGITEGNATNTGYYRRSGGYVDVVASIVFGNTTSVTGTVTLGLPKTMYSALEYLANVTLLDASVGYYPGHVSPTSSTAYNIYALNTASTYIAPAGISSTVPFTWITTDGIFVMARYRMANRYG